MDEGADKQEQEGLIASPTAPSAPTHPDPTLKESTTVASDIPTPADASPTSPDDDDQCKYLNKH